MTKPRRLLSGLPAIAAGAFVLTCESPTAPLNVTYVLASIDGRAVPTPIDTAALGDTVYSAVLGEQFQVTSDTTMAYWYWGGTVHVHADGTLSYTCQAETGNLPVQVRPRGDTLWLSPLYVYLDRDGLPLWVLRRGPDLVEPTIWGEYVFTPRFWNPPKLTC